MESQEILFKVGDEVTFHHEHRKRVITAVIPFPLGTMVEIEGMEGGQFNQSLFKRWEP